jgi:magnesium transporter
MIAYYKKEGKEIVEVDSLSEAHWVNLYPDFDHGEVEAFANKMDIPLDFLTDSLDIDERSRYEREDDVNLILINTPVLNSDDSKENEAIYITVPIGMILVKGILITICAKENPIIKKFISNRVKNANPKDRKLFILQIFEQNVFSFLECLKKLNLKRNLIEQELYNSSRNKELQQLLRIEKSLVYFVNSLSANELLKMKMKRIDMLSIRDLEVHTDLFEDLIIDNTQALEMSNVYTNILSGTMEAYASIVSNNMNIFIHRLTIITIILMVPTLVASFYGMNLEHLPFVENEYAFYVIILISLLLGFFLIWFFRRNKQF